MPESQTTSPRRITPQIRALIHELDLEEKKAIWVKYKRPKKFTPQAGECHINAWIQTLHEGGKIQSGWTFWQNTTLSFAECEFHTIWINSSRFPCDVTPRADGENEILFIPDKNRQIVFTKYDDQPAIKTFGNLRIQHGRIINLAEPEIRVLSTDLIHIHSLATHF